MFSPLAARVRRMPPKERQQLILLIVLTVFTSYALFGAFMWEQMFNAEKMANRKANRIETRIGEYQEPEIDASVNPQALATAQQQLTEAEKKLIRMVAHMLPLHSPEPREETKLALSRLALTHQVEITAFSTFQAQLRPLPDALSGDALRQLFKDRPYFEITSRANYYDFVHFVDAFTHLPYQGFIENLRIKQSPDTTDTRLTIEFKLQM